MARRHLTVAADYSRTGIPRRFWDASLDVCPSISARKETTAYIDGLEDYLERGVGRTFIGLPGVGKTTLAAIIGMRAVDLGVSVYYSTLAEYIRRLLSNMELREALDRHDDVDIYSSWKANRERILRIRNSTRLLVLDDVGKEHSTHTRYAEDEFDYLLRHRYDRGLTTVLTSNVTLKKWAGRYGDAMESFLHEAAPVIVMETDRDLRRK